MMRYTEAMKQSERSQIFVEEIHKWYLRHKRTLPWRDLAIKDDTQRAYQVLVSEVMLQQTQVERVKITYKNFLETFPTIESLAEASNGEVIMAWRGMGYNSRALRLRDTAISVVKNYNTNFPKEMKELQSLPGVGHYTAAAIRNFAFNLPTACLDTNIRRIYHRTFIGPEKADGTWKEHDRTVLKIAEKTLEKAVDHGFTGADWHAALMDFGSLVCTMRSPKWDICPLTSAGIMKSAYKTPVPESKAAKTRKEPGRMVGSIYIPNRIFRGKFVEELRNVPEGLTVLEVGRRICIDWDEAEHAEWIEELAEKLKKDQLIRMDKGRVLLAH
jgi:A/G-specific adenine glycosylase